MPEDDGMYFGTPSAPSAGTRRGGVNPVFEEYRKLYQNALEREAKAREDFNEEELYPLTDASGNPIPPKAPPQPYELESSKIVQQALQMGYDPRYNMMVPVPSEPLRGVNPQAFSQAAQSIADSGSRIVAPVDYSQAELTPYAGMETSAPPLNRFERMQTPSGVGVQTTQQQAVAPTVAPTATTPSIEALSKIVNSPEANEDHFSKYIENPEVPLSKRREALKKFEKMAESPPPRKDLDYNEAMRRTKNIQEALNNAKAAVESEEFTNKYVNPAWTEAKDQIAKKVEAFAKERGIAPENIYNGVLSNNKIWDSKRGYVSMAEAIFGSKEAHEDNSLVTDTLNKLEAVESERRPYRTFAKKILGEYGSRSNANILLTLATERASSPTRALPASESNASVAGQPKIEIGQPQKVQ